MTRENLLGMWFHKKDIVELYKGLLSRKEGDHECIAKLNQRFNVIFNYIPLELVPPKEVALPAYFNVFTGKLALNVKNKKPNSLLQAQIIIFYLDQAMRKTSINMLQVEDHNPPSNGK